ALVHLKVPGRHTFGSAFCVHPSGLFVTNEHVLRGAEGGTVQLVLNSGEKSQRVLSAKVARSTKEPDLALLRVESQDPLPALPLGTSEGLVELMEVVAFGFPFEDILALSKGEFPAISVNSGSVTSLRRKAGELHLVQVDVVLNPGNSGGPVLDPN